MHDKWIIQRRDGWDRQQVLAYQLLRFRELIRHLWGKSPFYRSFYSDHGLHESDLNQISVKDLPIISKEILMENFDGISNYPYLRRDALEAWIHSNAEGIYKDRYVVLHSSGSSGTLGLFVYDQRAWTRVRGVTTRVGSIRINPINRVRLAWYGATHGKFAGVTACRLLPSLLCDLRLCSVIDQLPTTLGILNDFQPEQLFGYASAVQQLAAAAIAGNLQIQPKFVTTSGDVLTEAAIALIERAWGVLPTNVYGTSESLCIGIQLAGRRNLTLMEDENIIEMLDDDDNDVAPGKVGRVVMTNLYNRAITIVRYDMRDYVTRGHREENKPFDNILRVEGRVNDSLPVTLQNGSLDSIHPVVLSEFFVPRIHKFQFVSESPASVTVRFVAEEVIDAAVRKAFLRILGFKGAQNATKVTVQKVDEIAADHCTGKHRLVVLPQK